MKALFFSLLLVCAAPAAFAQKEKVEVKEEVIFVDGAEYAQIEKDGCGMLDAACEYYVKTLDGKRAFTVRALEMRDPDEVTNVNTDGKVRYLQFSFAGSSGKAEIKDPSAIRLRALDVARKVAKAGLMKDGKLDDEAVSDFVSTNGTPFSERKKQLAGPKVIIMDAD